MAGQATKKLHNKDAVVQKLQADLNAATIALVLDYRGLSVAEMKELRRELLKENARLTIAKNTLLRRVINGTSLEAMTPCLKGPTAVLYTSADQIKPLKVVKDYLKRTKKDALHEIRGGVLDGKLLTKKDVEQLAELPSFDELRGKLVGALAYPQNALVRSLCSQQQKLVYVLSQVAQQKQA